VLYIINMYCASEMVLPDVNARLLVKPVLPASKSPFAIRFCAAAGEEPPAASRRSATRRDDRRSMLAAVSSMSWYAYRFAHRALLERYTSNSRTAQRVREYAFRFAHRAHARAAPPGRARW
jgi:hypothetical protein